jgi:triosephosphate isomerase
MQQLYVINFKAYKETTGENGLKVAKILDDFAKDTGEKIWIAVQPTDIRMISNNVSIPVLAQGFDPVEQGAKTAHVTLEAIISAGASGALINHSEKRVPEEIIAGAVEKCRATGKKIIVCAKDAKEAQKLSKLNPDFVAVEPPELIGGDVSVSNAKPEVVSESVKLSKVPVLVGAGVKNFGDVSKAAELGSHGVLVASGIVKSPDVLDAIKKLTGKAKP